jgi:hypothetical protein
MIDIYIIITITSLFVLVVTLFFTDYQIRKLYNEGAGYEKGDEKGGKCENSISEDMEIKLYNQSIQTDELQRKIEDANNKNTLLEKNINGIFENSNLTNEDKKCIDISSKKRGAFQYLELTDFEKCNDIFTYDPVNKHLLVKTNESTKCITSLNENDIILNDCVKTFDKQQFDYYPMHDGKFHSSLHSKCLSYNKDSNIIELDNCALGSNNISKRGNLFLPNS